MVQNYPLVSVIIPVYNSAKFLEETLQSVHDQTYPAIEIIVVDDGSTDDSAEIAQSYSGVNYTYQENQGVSVARNTGISKAGGEYIAFLDADDVWLPEKLLVQIDFMLKNPAYKITTTDKINFLEAGTELPDHLKQKDDWQTMEENIPSTMVAHRSVFNKIGNYSPDYQSSEDVEWIWRAKDANILIKKIEKKLVRRRFHGSNLSWILVKDHKANIMRILKESITRKKMS